MVFPGLKGFQDGADLFLLGVVGGLFSFAHWVFSMSYRILARRDAEWRSLQKSRIKWQCLRTC